MATRFTYSRWDGTQRGFDLDADAIMDQITDDLLYHGDINAALRRLMQNGLKDREGRDMQGVREMLDKLRQKRREMLEQHELGGVFDEIADQLRDVVDTERRTLDELTKSARESGDQRR